MCILSDEKKKKKNKVKKKKEIFSGILSDVKERDTKRISKNSLSKSLYLGT
jgi:hypothetical protein